MKMFLLLIFSVTALFVWQRQGNNAVTATKPNGVTPIATPTTPRPVSEHDWAKRSLDRAQGVADEVRRTRAQNDQP